MFVILLGPAGAGKGTQARLLADRLRVPAISTGEMFRDEMASDSPLGRRVADYINQGELVPDDITVAVLKHRIEAPDAADGAVLDGFPRTVPQARELDRLLGVKGTRVDRVVELEVPRAEILRRLAGRWTCPECHATFHETEAPPRVPGICDNCGARLYQRADDTEEAISTRLQVYKEQTAPLTEYYHRAGVLTAVDGGQERDLVTQMLLRAVMAERS